MTAPNYRRRNRFLARLGLCAAGGLVLGGLLAIPFSGGDGAGSVGSSTVAATTTIVKKEPVSTSMAPIGKAIKEVILRPAG